MYPDDRRRRRGWGAIAGLSAAVGAALAAAIIPAGVAFADSIIVDEQTLNNAEMYFLDHDAGLYLTEQQVAALVTTDKNLTDSFLGQLPGGPTGYLGETFEKVLGTGLGSDFSAFPITPESLAAVQGEFNDVILDYHLPATDATQLTDILNTLSADHLSPTLMGLLDGNLYMAFQDLLPTMPL